MFCPKHFEFSKKMCYPLKMFYVINTLLTSVLSDYFYMHLLYQVHGMHFEMAALSKPSIWGEASRIVNEEGFRAFWKGNLVTIAHRLPYSAVNFYAYERYKNVTSDALYIIFMWSSCCLSFLTLNQFHCFVFCYSYYKYLWGRIIEEIPVQICLCTS